VKVVYTEPALHDLDEITAWLKQHYPGLGRAVERRLRIVVAHIARWPESMRRSARRPDVRVAPLGRYPYKIFYRVRDDAIEILHIHHAAREPWDERE
jgi:plasmid stabilization system protein ParE